MTETSTSPSPEPNLYSIRKLVCRHGGRRSLGPRFQGQLVGRPRKGNYLVIFTGTHTSRVCTSRILRVVTAENSGALYVETKNSVYQLRPAA